MIFYCYWGKEKFFLYQGLRYIEVHYIKVPLYHFHLFIVLNTGKDGRDGRDGSGIKVVFLSFKHCFLFCLKSSEIQIK